MTSKANRKWNLMNAVRFLGSTSNYKRLYFKLMMTLNFAHYVEVENKVQSCKIHVTTEKGISLVVYSLEIRYWWNVQSSLSLSLFFSLSLFLDLSLIYMFVCMYVCVCERIRKFLSLLHETGADRCWRNSTVPSPNLQGLDNFCLYTVIFPKFGIGEINNLSLSLSLSLSFSLSLSLSLY